MVQGSTAEISQAAPHLLVPEQNEQSHIMAEEQDLLACIQQHANAALFQI